MVQDKVFDYTKTFSLIMIEVFQRLMIRKEFINNYGDIKRLTRSRTTGSLVKNK